jgi:hypothetical protein
LRPTLTEICGADSVVTGTVVTDGVAGVVADSVVTDNE